MFRLVILSSLLACALGLAIPLGMVPVPDGRIVGGQETTIESFPHQVSMQYFSAHRCGGSIFSQNTIITASHCVDGVIKSLTKIVAGTSSKSSGGSSQSVDKIIMHEGYNSKTFENDIAIIKLKGSFAYSDQIQPIGLPAAQEVIRGGSKAIVSGWGTLTEGGSSPSKLQYVEVQIVENVDCAVAYAGQYGISDSMLCAGVPEGGKDACQGDSGGPLIVGNKLVGVVSWGIGCARSEYPGVYSNVAYLRNWIDSKV